VPADGHSHSEADLLTDTKSFPKQTCDASTKCVARSSFVLRPLSLIPHTSSLVPHLNTPSPDPPR